MTNCKLQNSVWIFIVILWCMTFASWTGAMILYAFYKFTRIYIEKTKSTKKFFFDVIMPRSQIFHKCLNKFKISWVALWRMRNWCLKANGIFSLPYVICCLLLKIYVPSVNHNKLFAFCLNLHSISSQSFFFFGHLHRCTHTYTRAHIQIHSHLQ